MSDCVTSDVASIHLIYCSNDKECSQNTCYAATLSTGGAHHYSNTITTHLSPTPDDDEQLYDEPRVLL